MGPLAVAGAAVHRFACPVPEVQQIAGGGGDLGFGGDGGKLGFQDREAEEEQIGRAHV